MEVFYVNNKTDALLLTVNMEFFSMNYKDGIYQVIEEFQEQSSEVFFIEEIPLEEVFVYDLETENHHFHAGPGSLIVHNTDSVYIKFNTNETKKEKNMRDDQLMIKESIIKGYECSREISKTFPHPMNIVLEKTYYPYFISEKKRYAGDCWEPKNPADPETIPKVPKRDVKGIILKRRDNCIIAKNIFEDLLEALMKGKSKDIAIDILNKRLSSLVNGEYPLSNFVISKTLKPSYKNPKSQPHFVLMEKMRTRDPGSEPKSNDRVPYVFVKLSSDFKGSGKNGIIMQSDKVEHPDWVATHPEIQLDYSYYIEKQIKTPCMDLLKYVVDNADKYFSSFIELVNKKKCSALTLKKTKCTRNALQGSDVCTLHTKGIRELL